MSPRALHHGIKKICDCGSSRWPKCPHPWHFSYKPRGGARYRFSLDLELGRHVASKTEAETIATDIRSAIHAGTFRQTPVPTVAAPAAVVAPVMTLDLFAPIYIERAAKASGKASWKDDVSLLLTLRNHRGGDGRRFGDWALTAITEDELEVFHSALRRAGRAVSTQNHYVQLIKKLFRWAARKGYLARSPVSDESALKRGKVAQRSRRLGDTEEMALLTAAGTLGHGAGKRLQGLIIAAIETGCRQGELLLLRWADLDLPRRELTVRAANAKDGDDRCIPITDRLAAVLEMVTTDPAGRPYPPSAYVFGELGEPVGRITKAWETCVLRAHGVEPVWTTHGKLAVASRAALRAIDLHFHDLRHESGSRWIENGMPLHHVKELLGHKTISTTDTYLNAGRLKLQESMKRFEVSRGKLVANTPPIEHRPVRHDESEESPKDPLH